MHRVTVTKEELNEFNEKLQKNIEERDSRNPIMPLENKRTILEAMKPTLWAEHRDKWLSCTDEVDWIENK